MFIYEAAGKNKSFIPLPRHSAFRSSILKGWVNWTFIGTIYTQFLLTHLHQALHNFGFKAKINKVEA